MKAKLRLVLSTAIFFASISVIAQQNYWQGTTTKLVDQNSNNYYFSLDETSFKSSLRQAIQDNSGTQVVHFPDENGKMIAFHVKESSVLHPELAKRFPQIKSFVGWSADAKKKVRFSTSHRGVQVMLQDFEAQKTMFIQKESRTSSIYKMNGRSLTNKNFVCKTLDEGAKMMGLGGFTQKLVDDQTLRTYRLAVSASGDYTNYHGGTVTDALAAMNATITRVNEILERDVGVRLELVANVTNVIFTDPTTDPYSSGSNLLGEVQNELETTIGSANFDIGHLFHLDDDNGNAGGIGTVCGPIKGRAFSSANIPETDLYDLDYVGHEMGHQLGANHTWSFETEGTGVQAEPASGTTIMGYAGITGANNVAPNGDAYYHYNSIQQMTTYIRSQTCAVDTDLTNNVPVIVENPDYVIPAGTAFVLTGNATDPDAGDTLLYCWEQIDNGVVTRDTFGPENPIGANFRSLSPTTDASRYFPRLSRVISGNLTQSLPPLNSAWETVSTISREFNFALTVRDNGFGGGQVATEEVKVDVVDTGNVFAITSQSESSLQFNGGSVITVEWDVAGTNLPPISADFVDVFLSTDGGASFTIPLATAIPNDGSAGIQLPGTPTSQARIMVRANGNIFFAVNAENFEITASDFILNFDELEYTVCKPDNLTIDFVYETFNGFAGTTNLTANLPTGVSGTFTPSSVTTNDTAVSLALSDVSSLDVGSYPIEITGTSGGSTTEVDVLLHVFDSNLNDAVLLAPADLAVDTRINPTFSWEDDPNHASYEIEIATDDAFTNIVETGLVNVNMYESSNLDPSTTYFWRVRPSNNCAVGNYSAPFSFTTILIDCITVSAQGLPRAISNGAPSAITATVNLSQNLPIADIDVALELEHTYLGDLVISLTSPNGTKVLLTSNTCGPLNNINATFDDDGTEISCSGNPAISGTVRPLAALSTFNGEFGEGEWVLEIDDTAAGDGGQLIDFTVTFCVEGTFRPDEDEDGVFDDGDDLCLGTPKGVQVNTDGCQVYRFPTDNFFIEINNETCRDNNDGALNLNAVDTSLNYEGTLSGPGGDTVLAFNDQTSFTDLTAGNYSLCITGTDGINNYEETCFAITINEPEPLQASAVFDEQDLTTTISLQGGTLYNIEVNGVVTQTRETEITLDLRNGVNEIRVFTNLPCQGEFKETFLVNTGAFLAPNPTQDQVTLFLNDFSGELNVQLFSYDGRLIKSDNRNISSGRLDVQLNDFPSGLYLLKLSGNRISETFKILKR
ncbi:reprolysin-like metallopeptidase [Croceivirga thetidis]|uniref:T9SS type A sorting domain-containing protein n=1 Tax=Croceivirga thetidis TaxID=2721623 RepID=A0ABX1GML8_9FLAO|nr:zinc-dependent metalloprotease family protein [Croceivirga thetidis]NKI30814.1 T9SS type A sorting domain-containing protein [Croceivirga thetidis]